MGSQASLTERYGAWNDSDYQIEDAIEEAVAEFRDTYPEEVDSVRADIENKFYEVTVRGHS